MLYYVVNIQYVVNTGEIARNNFIGEVLKAFHKRNVPTKRYFRYQITPVLNYMTGI